ncbi:MAG TPA: hemolysin family protein [Candidatus Eisenbacteria bacterium]|nr:hemolysin family protein [Candidatus Eisenbacteria bacterium]
MTAAGALAILALIAANAFFVLAEFSLISVDRARVAAAGASGDSRAKALLLAVTDLTSHLSAAQFGITLSSLLIGFIAEPLVADLLHPLLVDLPAVEEEIALGLSLGAALVISSYLQMVIGEQVPKAIAIADPLRVGLLVARPLRAFASLTSPVVRALNASANALVRRLGVEPRGELAAARSVEELHVVIRESATHGSLDPDTARLLGRALRFRRKSAKEALTPRTAVVGLPGSATATDALRAAARSGHTGLPIYGAESEHVIGLARVEDALRVAPAARDRTAVTQLLRPTLVVPETKDLPSLLNEMRSARIQFAVVVDEYGGFAGIVTDEDLLEEIVGEIQEGPPGVALVTAVGLVPGNAHYDQVLEETGFSMPDARGEYETLAGFMLSRLGHIPEVGETVSQDGWTLTVADMAERRIAWVRVVPPATRTHGSDK